MVVSEYTSEMTRHNIDFILSPNSFQAIPETFGEVFNENDSFYKYKNPVAEYKMDFFTASANCLGVPALTMPVCESEQVRNGEKFNGFPTSIRLQGFFGEDFHLLRIGQRIEEVLRRAGMATN